MFADLRHAARALRRAPGFALAAILCLALGVGATTAVSALADSVLLRPLPLRDIDRMVVVQQDAPRLDITGAPLDAPATEELFARRDLFAAGAAFEVARYNLAAEGLAGPANLALPEPVRNADFARALGHVLGRPALLPQPAFALRLALGRDQADEMLLASQRAVPRRLLGAGFAFRRPDVEGALRFELGR